MPDTLLIIEDEDLLRRELARHFESGDWIVLEAADLGAAREILHGDDGDPLVVLADMSLPDGNALDLLEQVRARAGPGEWILLTAYGSVPDSVRALRLGAFDFLEKPCPLERLDLVVAGAARSARAQRRLREQTAQEHERYRPGSFLGASRSSTEVRRLIQRLLKLPLNTLVITGETGTGKGLVARILHYNGLRAQGPMVEVNCAALPSELLESELFGHEAGAFTGAKGRHRGLMQQAHGGTILLDEIGDLGLPLQAKLLKAIEDRRIRRLGGEREIEVDVQVFAASNTDLAALAGEGEFREDLYHRLAVLRIDLPPLRERIDDLEELVGVFIAEQNVRVGKSVKSLPEDVWEMLKSYRWPGNVRELRNVIERGVLLAESEVFPREWLQLPGELRPAAEQPGRAKREGDFVRLPLDGSMTLDDMERFIIEIALDKSHQNVTAAARSLGTTRQTLRYRIEKHGLKPER
ncbi:MAG: sigma-54 dependent transcriptional regulator [Gemmatimonadales bacterium]|jgi:DNA-binding NtrC family response regulator